MATKTIDKKGYSVYEVARRLGITPQAIYNYIDKFFDDFTNDGCVEVKKKGLQKRHRIKDVDRFLKILKKKGAEFET